MLCVPPVATATLQAPPVPPASSLLAEITVGLSTGRDLRELLQRFIEPVVRLASVQGGAVRVLSAAGKDLDPVSQMGLSSQICRQERSIDRHCVFCGAAADGPQMAREADLGDSMPAALPRCRPVPLQ